MSRRNPMRRRRGRPTVWENEAAGQLRLNIDATMDAQTQTQQLTRAVRKRKRAANQQDDQLRLRMFSDLNRTCHAMNVLQARWQRQIDEARELLQLAA